MTILPKHPNRVPTILQRVSGQLSGISGGIGLRLVKPGESDMATISKSGVYTDADGNRYVGREGDTLPQGWTYAGPVDAADERDPTALSADEQAKAEADAKAKTEAEERAKSAAPNNRMKNGAPENRSA